MNLKELRTALQERREDFSASDAKLNRKINQAYLDICSRRKWGWLRREHSVTTEAPVTITGAVGAANSIQVNEGDRTIVLGSNHIPAQNTDARIGKRIIIDGDFYEIESISPDGSTLHLDRPYMGTSYPTGVAPIDYGSIQIMYDEYALPPGAHSIIESVIYTSPNSSAVALNAIHPAMIARRDRGDSGTPTSCSVVEKRPIRRPAKKIGALTPVSGATTDQLTPGSTDKYWYSHVDIMNGAESALSESTEVTLRVTDDSITVPAITPRRDYIVRLYRSMANGSTPYLHTTFTPGGGGSADLASFTDTVSDDYLMKVGPSSPSTMFLRLSPAPNSHCTLQILYQSEAVAMTDDNDRPLFDTEYVSVLLDGAELLMLTSSDEQSRASFVQRNYESGIQRMITNDRLNFQQKVLIGRNGRRLRGRPNWWYGAFPDYGNSGLP